MLAQEATHALFSLHSLGAFAALAGLEIVLGIDNVVFISILASKLEPSKQKLARRMGLALAAVGRILLLLLASWITKLEDELFHVFGHGFSGKDLFLFAGGAFLIGKATHEIYAMVEGGGHGKSGYRAASFKMVLVQIIAMDLIFSIDSVITAVGMAEHLQVMIAAIIVAILIMMLAAEAVAKFIERHPSFKMLGLAFLVMIGVMLTMDGLGNHVERGYVYVAMGFALFVDVLQMLAARRTKKGAHAA